MKQILFKLFENLKQLGIKPNIGSRTNVTPIPGSEIDRLINRPVTPKEFDYSKPEVVDSMKGIIQNASDYVGQFTERQLKTFNDNVERILGVIKPKEITADVVDIATKEKITGPGLESLMKEKGVAPISRKTIEAETLIKQFLDDDLISLNAKQIDQLSRGKAEDVFENIFGSKAKELITGKNTNESLNEVYNKLKTTKDTRGRLPDDPSFDPSDINFKDGGSVSEDVKKLLKEEFIELINEDPESFPDTNSGFRRFLKRKGSPVFNYKKGGEVKEPKQTDAEIEEEIRENKKELLGKKSILDLYKGNTLFGLDLDFADKNIGGEFGKYNKKDIKDPRIGLSIIPNVQDDTSSRWGISIGPKGGGLTFMKPFSQIGLSGDWEEVPESWYEDNIPDVNVLIPELPEMKKGGRVNLRQGGGLYPEELLPLIGKDTELSNRELEKLFSESDMSEEDISKYYKKYPIKLGDLEINPRVNITSGDFSPNPFTTVSDKSQLSGGDIRYKIKDGIYATGSLDKQRNSRKIKYDFPFMDEAITQSNTYKRSPYTVGLDYEGDQSVITSAYDPEQKQFNIRGTYLFEPGGGLNKLFKGYGGMKKGGVANLFKKRKRYANGGVASMFRERPGYADGGSYEGVLTAGNKQKITPEFLYQMEGQFGNDQEGKIRRLKDSYQQSIDYAKSFGPNTKFAGGYGLPDLSPEEYIAKKQEELNLQLSQYDDYNKLIKPKIPTSSNERAKLFEFIYGPSPEVPTVDPFSGQQVSAQDQAAFTQPQAEIFPQQELPTVTPEAPFQPYEGQSTPYDFISSQLQNIFNNPAVKGYSNFITGSGNPFQDINQFTTAQQNVINQTIQNAANQGRTNITYADYPQTGIAQLMDDGFTPMEYLKTLGSSMFGNPVDQIKTTLGQFSYNPETNKIFDRYDFQRQSGNNLGTPYDVNINLRNNPVQRTVNVGSSDIGTQALGASVGNLDFATMNALRNNADLLNNITGQTTNMAKGGRVSMSNGGLTNTIPPDRGPSPQGVESLFTRRYN